jgi:hypothetical protein
MNIFNEVNYLLNHYQKNGNNALKSSNAYKFIFATHFKFKEKTSLPNQKESIDYLFQSIRNNGSKT